MQKATAAVRANKVELGFVYGIATTIHIVE